MCVCGGGGGKGGEMSWLKSLFSNLKVHKKSAEHATKKKKKKKEHRPVERYNGIAKNNSLSKSLQDTDVTYITNNSPHLAHLKLYLSSVRLISLSLSLLHTHTLTISFFLKISGQSIEKAKNN